MELKNKQISKNSIKNESTSCACGCLGEMANTDKEIENQDSFKKIPD